MSSCKNFTCEGHFIFISFITLLEFWLALSDKADNLNSSCPSMLNKCSILNFNVKPSQTFTGFRVDIVFVDVMNSAISSIFRCFYVVVFIGFITAFMIELSLVKSIAKFI